MSEELKIREVYVDLEAGKVHIDDGRAVDADQCHGTEVDGVPFTTESAANRVLDLIARQGEGQ